eukprot:GHVQ01022941.1.p1 GENE.GHVQ01022941.1~~GHVQ01022941.1.p1  ORF type:complete len:296 (-),score=32.77 GHVQ01022941.1:501-1388(-)
MDSREDTNHAGDGIRPETQIGFVGFGAMGSALAEAFVKSNVCTLKQIIAYDPMETLRTMCAQKGYNFVESAKEVAVKSDVIFLAVKPQALHKLASQLGDVGHSVFRGVNQHNKLIISIIAGVTIRQLQQCLQSEATPVARVMPNTPCLIGKGASAFDVSSDAAARHIKIVNQLMSSVGVVHRVSEQQLDAVTGLSGSGPAYVYTMIEAMCDAGVLKGLPRDVARSLAVNTVLGSALLVDQTGEHTAMLRDKVTSPGGTTIAGVAALEANGFRHAVMSAVDAATRRSAELGATQNT